MSKLEQLKNGDCALHNTGTVDELNRVLQWCFPEDEKAEGSRVFYEQCDNDVWGHGSVTSLPSYPTSDFIAELDAMEDGTDIDVLTIEQETKSKGSNFKVVSYNRHMEVLKENEELKAKLSELQPYARGTEGWAGSGLNDWDTDKSRYLCPDLEGRGHYMEYIEGDKECEAHWDYNFTTENPHKKETVFTHILNFSNNMEFYDCASNYPDPFDKVYYCGKHLGSDQFMAMNSDKSYNFLFGVKGDEFDDPNNTKFIDLTK